MPDPIRSPSDQTPLLIRLPAQKGWDIQQFFLARLRRLQTIRRIDARSLRQSRRGLRLLDMLVHLRLFLLRPRLRAGLRLNLSLRLRSRHTLVLRRAVLLGLGAIRRRIASPGQDADEIADETGARLGVSGGADAVGRRFGRLKRVSVRSARRRRINA